MKTQYTVRIDAYGEDKVLAQNYQRKQTAEEAMRLWLLPAHKYITRGVQLWVSGPTASKLIKEVDLRYAR